MKTYSEYKLIKRVAILLSLLVISCSVKIKSDPVKVDPIKVDHSIKLDTEELYKHFQEECALTVTNPNDQAEINSCADLKLNDFIERFTL